MAVTYTHRIMCYYSHLQKGGAPGEADFGSDLNTELCVIIHICRREVHQARQTLAVIHNKLGKEPRSAHDTKMWRASLNKFKEQISEVNIKINKFNLIVPLLNKQKMPYNAEREVRKVLDNVEDYLPEDQNACQAWDVSVREMPPLASSPQQTIDWAQVWQDIKKVFTSS